jgi:molybdopterin/thiamine biosynthesis adenylyltransferase
MTFSDDEIDRYARHLVLREVGGPGQQRLKAAQVLIVGVGGIGSPAALYLAAAGVGRIVLVDPDKVEVSNLQRQIMFDEDDVGDGKVWAADHRLGRLNTNVKIDVMDIALNAQNAASYVGDVDMVLDGTDDFATRYAVNAACVALGKPLVTAALGRWTGQVGVFHGKPCWRCLVPEMPPEAETCARVGVVGALAGVMGSMAALEVVKLVTGAGRPLDGRLLVYDGLNAEVRVARVAPDPSCAVCGDARAI